MGNLLDCMKIKEKKERRGIIMELLEKQFLEAKNVLKILEEKYKIDKKYLMILKKIKKYILLKIVSYLK